MCIREVSGKAFVLPDAITKVSQTDLLDRPESHGASILVVSAQNFGLEDDYRQAMTALKLWSIKALLGTSFDVTFREHATTEGIVCAEISDEDHDVITRHIRGEKDLFIIDLHNLTIITARQLRCAKIHLPDEHRRAFLNDTFRSLSFATH